MFPSRLVDEVLEQVFHQAGVGKQQVVAAVVGGGHGRSIASHAGGWVLTNVLVGGYGWIGETASTIPHFLYNTAAKVAPGITLLLEGIFGLLHFCE